MALEDAAAGPHHLDKGREWLAVVWRALDSLPATGAQLEARAAFLKAARMLSGWAVAAVDARPSRAPAHETAQASARRAALMKIEVVAAQTGEQPALSHRIDPSSEKAGKPGGPRLRLTATAFAQLRCAAALYPETRIHAGSPVLTPGDETLAEWLRTARGRTPRLRHLARRRREQPFGRKRSPLPARTEADYSFGLR